MRRQPDSIRSSLRTEADSAPMDSAVLATARSITAPEEAVSVPVILAASAGMRIFSTICSVSISKGQKGSGRGSRANYRSKGQDVESGITISFDEAMHGCDKTFTLRDPATGKSESVQVHIPAGIDTGKSIRLKGKGGEGYSGGESGDLYLKVTVQEKPGWEQNPLPPGGPPCLGRNKKRINRTEKLQEYKKVSGF